MKTWPCVDQLRACGGRRTSAAACRCGGRRSRRPSAGRSCGSAACRRRSSLPVPQPSAEMMSLQLAVGEHLAERRLLGVEHLAAQRQDGLGLAVAALLGRAAGGVALDDEQLALGRVGRAAVGELAGQVEPVRHGASCAAPARGGARGAARARAARMTRSAMAWPACGCAADGSRAPVRMKLSIGAVTSGLLSRSFVCPWNCGSWM